MHLTVALDVDFLIALAAGDENAAGAMDTISRLRGYAIATPSVLQELADQAINQTEEAFRNPAQLALRELSTWGVITPSLESKEHAICDINAQKMVSQKLAPDYQSALILAEAACQSQRARVLLTYNPKWYNDIDFAVLKIFLLQVDLCDCFPLPPPFFNQHLAPQPQKGGSESASPDRPA